MSVMRYFTKISWVVNLHYFLWTLKLAVRLAGGKVPTANFALSNPLSASLEICLGSASWVQQLDYESLSF